jgi:hypothetical protein
MKGENRETLRPLADVWQDLRAALSAVDSVSNDTRVRFKTFLHITIQQQRIRILRNGRHRFFGCPLDVCVLRGSKTWNEASVELRCM